MHSNGWFSIGLSNQSGLGRSRADIAAQIGSPRLAHACCIAQEPLPPSPTLQRLWLFRAFHCRANDIGVSLLCQLIQRSHQSIDL